MNGSTNKAVRRFAVPLAATAMLLSSCATPTPYQPRIEGARTRGGYSEQRIAENRYRVMFAGNSLTSRERVENYLLFRAAELTRQAGNDCFAAARRGTDPRIRISQYPGWGGWGWGGYWGPSWRYGWGGRWGAWGPYGWGYDPFWGGDVDVRVSYEAFAEITMSRGPCGPEAFSAEDVIRNLGPSIRYPENR
jgi:hypothetical protein